MKSMRRLARTFMAIIAALAALALAPHASGRASPPQRVVSMNVCTDQLAMLVAGQGQLHSVSYLAGEPGTSVMAEQAARYAANHGLAEEIFLMKPDLVLAGTFSTRTTVDLLRRVGLRVEEFTPEATFEDIRANILRMGEILGRRERANELVAELDDGLSALRVQDAPKGSVAIYSSNSFTTGPGSLSHTVIKEAGLENIADRLGIVGTGYLPLEALVMADPDIIVLGERDYGGPALAQQNFVHPAFKAITEKSQFVRIPDRYWICGAPFTLEAVRLLRDAANEASGVRQ